MASRFILPYADVGPGISPSDGAKLNFFDTGTNTERATWSDVGMTALNTNPVIADANGVFPDIFIDGVYKVVLTDKNDVEATPGEFDPITSVVNTFTETDPWTLSENFTAPGSTTLIKADDYSNKLFSGAGTFTITIDNIASVGWDTDSEVWVSTNGGTLNILPGAGVTFLDLRDGSAGGIALNVQGQSGYLKMKSADLWSYYPVNDPTLVGGLVSLDDGTEASPSLRFTSDTSTGLFAPAVGELSVTLSGSEFAEFKAARLEVFADVWAHRSGSATSAELVALNLNGGSILSTNLGTTALFRTDNALGSQQAILSHTGAEVSLFSPAGITPGLKITGDQTQVVLRASGFEPIAAENTDVTFTDLSVSQPASVSEVKLDVTNQDGGVEMTTVLDFSAIARTDSTGVTAHLMLSQQDTETNIYPPAGLTAGIKLISDNVQQVLRPSGYELIAAENTTPTFDGALFTDSVLIDVPLPGVARFDIRNDDGGASLSVDNGIVSLIRTDAVGNAIAGAAVFQSDISTIFFAPLNNAASLTIDALESQKVRRGGADRLIAAEGTSPTFSGMEINGDLLIDNNALGAAKITLLNLDGGMSISVDGGELSITRTNGAGVDIAGPAIKQTLNETQLFFPGEPTTAALAVTSNKTVKTFDQSGTVFSTIATMLDALAIGDLQLSLTGGAMTGTTDYEGIGGRYINTNTTNNKSGIFPTVATNKHSLNLTGGQNLTDGGSIVLFGDLDNSTPGDVAIRWGSVSTVDAILVDGEKSAKAWNLAGDTFEQISTVGDTFNGGIVNNSLFINNETDTSDTFLGVKNLNGGVLLIAKDFSFELVRQDAVGNPGTGPAVRQTSSLTEFYFPNAATASIVIDADKSVKTFNQAETGLFRVATIDDVAASQNALSATTALAVSDFDVGATVLSDDDDITLSSTTLTSLPLGAECVIIVHGVGAITVTATVGTLFKQLGNGVQTSALANVALNSRVVITKITATEFTISGIGLT